MSDEFAYLDTSILVTPFLKNREQSVLDRCELLLERAASGHALVVTSWLTWDEATWAYGRAHGKFDRASAIALGEALLQVECLRFVSIDRATVTLANRLLAETGCRPRDCLHAASALIHASGRLFSLDSDFKSASLASLGLRLCEP